MKKVRVACIIGGRCLPSAIRTPRGERRRGTPIEHMMKWGRRRQQDPPRELAVRFAWKSAKILFLLVLLAAPCYIVLPANADTQNFHFSDFTGDYYLTKDAEGISHLRVVESVTAEFPDFNQNKGICRQIPYTNQDGKNTTLSSLSRDNIKLLRNGAPEPIYSIEKVDNFYNVCTGTEEYVLGSQTYTFEYEFEKVVTDFKDYQELYWDTNGNGAVQRFNKVTARVHFDNSTKDYATGKTWCYVGKYGEKGQDRCTTTEIEDGVQFSANSLMSHENLTFDIELKPDSFVVPPPAKNYAYVWITVITGLICLYFIGLFVRKFIRTREKANYYKGLFVKPEYQPHKNYSLAEMTEVYLGKKKDVKVALLLEMLVKHEVELKKNDNKKWSVILKRPVDGEYLDLLRILNGWSKPEIGEEIEIKRHTANSSLISLKKSMEQKILSDLKADKLVEEKYQIGDSSKRGIMNIIVSSIIFALIANMAWFFLLGIMQGLMGLDSAYGAEFVFYDYFYVVSMIMIVGAVIICVALNDNTQKFATLTREGLEASRYMEGLELYIRMAEADRMKFLQSVDGADVSATGIDKLYEKLLPYAAVFGLEESWMNEMKDYCKVEEIEEPDYLLTGIAVHEISRSMRNAASYATTSTVMSSSGGGSSSGFSGGGGGGFSGGGGGGGGFGGR